MNAVQARMAMAALGWSQGRLAEASGVDRRDLIGFMAGESVSGAVVEAMRRALEAEGVHFLMNGPHKGAVVPPPPKPVEDQSGGRLAKPFTPEALAERWRCSPEHIRKLCRRGELEYFRLGPKLIRIPAAEVERVERELGPP